MIIYLFRPNTQKKQLQHLMNLFADKRIQLTPLIPC
jgi:hypothetical protein